MFDFESIGVYSLERNVQSRWHHQSCCSSMQGGGTFVRWRDIPSICEALVRGFFGPSIYRIRYLMTFGARRQWIHVWYTSMSSADGAQDVFLLRIYLRGVSRALSATLAGDVCSKRDAPQSAIAVPNGDLLPLLERMNRRYIIIPSATFSHG